MKNALLIMLVFSASLFAQNSNYSAYGFGIESPSATVRNLGMAGTGAAMVDSISVNTINPALWTNFFTTSLQGQIYSSNLAVQQNSSVNSLTRFQGFAFKMPIGKRMGFALGMSPRTRSIGQVSFTDSTEYAGTMVDYQSVVKSVGGISSFYIGSGYRINQNLSLGMKLDLLFGSYLVKTDTDFGVDDEWDSFFKKETSISGSQLGVGFLWNFPKIGLNIAGVYEHPLGFEYTQNFNYYYGDDSTGTTQSLKYPSSLRLAINQKVLKNTSLNFDIQMGKVSSTIFQKFCLFDSIDAKDPIYIGLGIEKQSEPYEMKNIWKMMAFRGGIFYRTESIYRLDPVQETGVSLGVGFPFNRNQNRLDFTVVYSHRDGFLNQEIGIEKVLDFHIGITTGEMWFQRFSRH
ncbi:MAG: hypothetical protein PHW79_01455 [Candidatus Marinimicrobia bacterium]|nr:hypothetical protein [Candidatus Neomarinimicrobiota bacterium]